MTDFEPFDLKHATVITADRQYVKVGVRVEPDQLIVRDLRGAHMVTFIGRVTKQGDEWEIDNPAYGQVRVNTEKCGCGGTRVNVWVDGRWVEERRARRQGLIAS